MLTRRRPLFTRWPVRIRCHEIPAMKLRARSLSALAMYCVALLYSLPLQAQSPAPNHEQFSFAVPNGVTVVIVNTSGKVYIRPGSARTVSIVTSSLSPDAKVDAHQNGGRVQARTRPAGARVDYDVTVPQSADVTVEDESGQVRIENLRGSVSVSGESPDV